MHPFSWDITLRLGPRDGFRTIAVGNCYSHFSALHRSRCSWHSSITAGFTSCLRAWQGIFARGHDLDGCNFSCLLFRVLFRRIDPAVIFSSAGPCFLPPHLFEPIQRTARLSARVSGRTDLPSSRARCTVVSFLTGAGDIRGISAMPSMHVMSRNRARLLRLAQGPYASHRVLRIRGFLLRSAPFICFGIMQSMELQALPGVAMLVYGGIVWYGLSSFATFD